MYNSDRDYLLTSVLDADGNLLRLTDESGRYNESFPQDRERDYPDQQLVQDTKEKLMAFLQSFYPAAYARIEDLEMEFSFEANGVLYFTFEEYPHRPENSVSFIVRVLPEFLIDDYSSLNMG